MNDPVGTLKLGTVQRYNSARGKIEVTLDLSGKSISPDNLKKIDVPFSLYSFGGLFIGTIPEPGTTVVVGAGEGGQWYFVSFLRKNTDDFPNLKSGEILLQASDDTKITLNRNSTINIGSFLNNLYINTDRNIIIDNFDNKLSFTQAGRDVNGLVLRDIAPNKNISSSSRLDDSEYDRFLTKIGLDPSSDSNNFIRGSTKNPPFVEKRELVYEFLYSSNVEDDYSEASLYTAANLTKPNFLLANRRKNRTDTLSLSLVSPNYLLETVKGTVVDIFGNILDLNRQVIPIGKKNLTLRPSGDSNKADVFLKIKALQRKSLAYHFEINARKDLIGNTKRVQLPDIKSNADYARNRSRFFIDIDKEGQLKVNVPASSETGNVPLLVRYENYSTYGPEDSGNVNKHYINDDRKDIYLDSFANSYKPSTSITDGGNTLTISNMIGISIKDENGSISPNDRIIKKGNDPEPIKHNMPYHNILDTCYVVHSLFENKFLDYQHEKSFDLVQIPTIKDIVSNIIKVGGTDANAGGRSGSLNFDGSLELSIGANTIDRQSLWLDTAGGILANIGRDKNYISAAISMDGDLILQVGGLGITGDSRFMKQGINNAWRPGAIDIRVFNSGFDCTMIRVDDFGIKISTPGNMNFYSGGDMVFKSMSNIQFEAEIMTVNGRLIAKHLEDSL